MVKNPVQAVRQLVFPPNRVMFCAMDHCAGWIREKAATSLNPSQVETTLVQLNEQWPANVMPLIEVVGQFPLGEAALLHLLAVSSICATRLTRDPGTLLWLAQPDVCLASRGYTEMLAELQTLECFSARQEFRNTTVL